jgi:hypothetical protein
MSVKEKIKVYTGEFEAHDFFEHSGLLRNISTHYQPSSLIPPGDMRLRNIWSYKFRENSPMTESGGRFENHVKTLIRRPGFSQFGFWKARPGGHYSRVVMKWIIHLGTPSKK